MTLPPPAEARSTLARLLRYALPHRRQLFIGALGMGLYASTDAGTAWFVSRFLKAVFVHPDMRVVWLVPAGVLVLFFCRGLGDYVATSFPARVGRKVVKAMRRDLFDQYLHLPAARYDRESTARMLSRLTYDTEQVAEAATNSMIVVVRDSLSITGLIGYMFWKSWRFTLLALVVAPLIGWVIARLNRRFRRQSALIQQSMGDVTRIAKESLEGQRAIKDQRCRSRAAAALRGSERAEPAQPGEVVARARLRQSEGAVHRSGGACRGADVRADPGRVAGRDRG